MALRDIYEPYGLAVPTNGLPATEKLFDCTAMAELLGVMSKSGKPHKSVIAAIIDMVGTTEEEVVVVPFSMGGYADAMKKYKQPVLERVAAWLKDHGYPTVIQFHEGKKFMVHYIPAV